MAPSLSGESGNPTAVLFVLGNEGLERETCQGTFTGGTLLGTV